MLQRLKGATWFRLAAILGMLLMIWLVALAVDIYTYSFVSDLAPADAAIVLGAAVWNDQPSPVFEERIRHAISLYQTRRVKAIIFTGGAGADEPQAESIVASQYAIQHGVAAQDIFCETTSQFTFENLRGAKAIIQQQHFGRALIVSDPLHLRRSMTMAHDLGINAYSSPTPTSRYISAQSQIDFLWGEVRYYATYLIRKPFMDTSPAMNSVQPCQ
jgi:uncharacterized SAM-binding protein YcdF (DUF218 family)